MDRRKSFTLLAGLLATLVAAPAEARGRRSGGRRSGGGYHSHGGGGGGSGCGSRGGAGYRKSNGKCAGRNE